MSKYLDIARAAAIEPKTDREVNELDESDQPSTPGSQHNEEVADELDESDELGPQGWPSVLDLLAERRTRAIVLADGGPDGLVIVDPRGALTSDFEVALRARSVELLGLLRDNARLTAPVDPATEEGLPR